MMLLLMVKDIDGEHANIDNNAIIYAEETVYNLTYPLIYINLRSCFH